VRNVALEAVTLGHRPRRARTAARTSTALLLFSFSLGTGWPLLVTTLLGAAVGVAWLVMTSWREFTEQLPPAAARPAPWSWALSLGLLGGLSFFAGVLLYPDETPGLLQQFIDQTSLANQKDEARASLHKGENLEAFEDLANEQSGAASGGAGDSNMGNQWEKSGGGRKARQFSLVRQPHPPRTAGQERVLFQVKERGAGHLPMVSYDRLEDGAWQGEMTGPRTQVAVEIAEDRSWRHEFPPLPFQLDPDTPDPELRSPNEAEWDAVERSRRALSKLALAMQGGGREVSPQRHALDRGKVQQLLGKWDEYAHLDYRLSPYDQAVIREHLRRKYGNEGLERFASAPEFRNPFLQDYLDGWRQDPGAALPPDLRALVESWVGNQPRGWGQIDALVQGLRGHAQYDPDETVPPGQADPIRYFLLESRRGPDYLFASSATVLLRHLGYPSRMVGGFYIRPGDYRLLSGSTPVKAGDLHYWTQVQANGFWINLEPTPGFEPTRPAYSFTERLSQSASELWQEGRQHGVAVLAALVLGVGAFACRRRLAERLATLWWRLRSGLPVERLVRATWRLLERRARAAGQPRRPGVTLTAWSAAVGTSAPEVGQPLAALAAIADWLLHSPSSAVTAQAGAPAARLALAAGLTEGEIRLICARAVRDCTVRLLRQAPFRLIPLPGGTHGDHGR
jgi:transglutaminase-like putative cysteine protease